MQSGSAPDDQTSRVQDLIMHTNNAWNPVTWNPRLVHALYDPDIARNILSTPLSFCTIANQIIWSGDNSGVYTAKTGF